ncbi:hypothetical protein [Sulfurimonas sp.]|uniref:hypothetical protein n=1 Tax=Sulfurimonas sp. TaxID=2022749 RepID=UPI0025F0FD6B|nr:hypothetical protein [Sulfurimonas sp.]
MKNWRNNTEASLEAMGDKITQHPIKIIFLIMIISFAIISNLPKITIDTSTEGFLHKSDPALVRYEAFKEQFGKDEKIMVVVKAKDVFESSFLKKT